MNVEEQLQKHRVPCGALIVSASGVCRQRLKPVYDALLDRLTEETHPEYVKPAPPKGYELDEKGNLVNTAVRLQKEKEKTLKSVLGGEKGKGKGKSKEPGFEEALLMGNSKLLQNPTGKIEPR